MNHQQANQGHRFEGTLLGLGFFGKPKGYYQFKDPMIGVAVPISQGTLGIGVLLRGNRWR